MARQPTLKSANSSRGFASAVVVRPEASRLLRGYWWAVHTAAGLALLLSGLPVYLAAAVAVALSANACWRMPGTAPDFVVQGDGSWTVPAWDVVALAATPGSFRSPILIRVVLDTPRQGRRSLLLTSDAIPADQWRRLRVLLGP